MQVEPCPEGYLVSPFTDGCVKCETSFTAEELRYFADLYGIDSRQSTKNICRQLLELPLSERVKFNTEFWRRAGIPMPQRVGRARRPTPPRPGAKTAGAPRQPKAPLGPTRRQLYRPRVFPLPKLPFQDERVENLFYREDSGYAQSAEEARDEMIESMDKLYLLLEAAPYNLILGVLDEGKFTPLSHRRFLRFIENDPAPEQVNTLYLRAPPPRFSRELYGEQVGQINFFVEPVPEPQAPVAAAPTTTTEEEEDRLLAAMLQARGRISSAPSGTLPPTRTTARTKTTAPARVAAKKTTSVLPPSKPLPQFPVNAPGGTKRRDRLDQRAGEKRGPGAVGPPEPEPEEELLFPYVLAKETVQVVQTDTGDLDILYLANRDAQPILVERVPAGGSFFDAPYREAGANETQKALLFDTGNGRVVYAGPIAVGNRAEFDVYIFTLEPGDVIENFELIAGTPVITTQNNAYFPFYGRVVPIAQASLLSRQTILASLEQNSRPMRIVKTNRK